MYDIIIIGAGTAGLSAAIYGVRAGKQVLLLEENVYGGQIISAAEVENYPGIRHISGYEFAEDLCQQAIDLGAELKYEKAVRIEDKEGEKNRHHESLPLYLQSRHTGDRSEKPQAGAEKRRGADRSRSLLLCHLRRCVLPGKGYSRRRRRQYSPGGCPVPERLLQEGISDPQKRPVPGRREAGQGFAGKRKCVHGHGKPGHRPEREGTSGIRRREKQMYRSRGGAFSSRAFIAVGQEPDNRAFSELVRLDAYGYVEAGEDCRTSREGIFTAGDCRTKEVRQLATAAADGAVAALAACTYLSGI